MRLTWKRERIIKCGAARNYVVARWSELDPDGKGHLNAEDLKNIREANKDPFEQSILVWLEANLQTAGEQVGTTIESYTDYEWIGESQYPSSKERTVPVFGVTPNSIRAAYENCVQSLMEMRIYVPWFDQSFTMPADANREQIDEAVRKRFGKPPLIGGMYDRRVMDHPDFE